MFEELFKVRGSKTGRGNQKAAFSYENIIGVNYVDSPYAMQPNQSPYAVNMDFGYPFIGSMRGVRGYEALFPSLGEGRMLGLHNFKHSKGDYLLAAWDKYLHVLTGDTGVISQATKEDWDNWALTDIDTASGDMKLEAGVFSSVATATADFDGTHSNTQAVGDKVELASAAVAEARICRLGGTAYSSATLRYNNRMGQTFLTLESTSNISKISLTVKSVTKAGTIVCTLWDSLDKTINLGSVNVNYTSGSLVIAFPDPIAVQPSTQYYFELTTSNADIDLSGTQYDYYSGGDWYIDGETWSNRDLVGSVYSTTPSIGTYTHGELDPSAEGKNKDIYITYNKTTPTGTYVTMQYRLSTNSGVTWEEWADADSGDVLIPAGTIKNGYRLQWRAKLLTNLDGVNPSLDDVSVLATNAALGEGVSPFYDLGHAPATANLTLDQTVPEGCGTTWYARASSNATVWGDWQEVFASGDSIPLQRYVQLKVVLTTPPPYTSTPIISGLIITYSTNYAQARRLATEPLGRNNNLLTGNRMRFVNYGDWCVIADGLRPFILYVEDGTQESGTTQGGGEDSITLQADASEEDDWYNNALITITGGPGEGQIRWITDYDGETKRATVSEAWDVIPEATSAYSIGSAFKVRNAGIDPPVLAPGGTASAESGSPNGSYKLKYTFVNKDGVESNPSPASESVSVSGKKITWTVPVDDTPYNRTASRRLYRTAASGAVYKYVGEIDNNTGTTFTDNLSDTALGSLMADNNNAPPASCSLVAEFTSYLFYIDTYDVWFSKAGSPDQVPNIPGDIQQMTFPGRVLDIKAHPTALIIGGEDFMATITSNTGFIFDSDPVIDTTTTKVIDKYGSLSAEGSAMCLSPDLRSTLLVPTLTGIRATIPGLQDNSIESVPLSRNIQPYYDRGLNRDRSAAVFWNNYYIYSMEHQDEAEAELKRITFAYDLRTKEWYGPWEFGMACYAIVDNVLYGGSTEDGKIYRLFTGSSFDGEDIPKVCDLPMRAPAGEHGTCKFKTLTVIASAESDTTETVIKPKVDAWTKNIPLGKLVDPFTGPERPGHNVIRTRKYPIYRNGHTFSLRIEDESVNPLAIEKLIAEYDTLNINK